MSSDLSSDITKLRFFVSRQNSTFRASASWVTALDSYVAMAEVLRKIPSADEAVWGEEIGAGCGDRRRRRAVYLVHQE